ncbi:MAG: hypothetical protein IPK53_18090 [bacterium]|nr:hypothetical protein [bacterium]
MAIARDAQTSAAASHRAALQRQLTPAPSSSEVLEVEIQDWQGEARTDATGGGSGGRYRHRTPMAPFSTKGTTCGFADDCSIAPSEDVVIKVGIPTSGNWSFSPAARFSTRISRSARHRARVTSVLTTTSAAGVHSRAVCGRIRARCM